jgi:hypothetical protein
MDFFLLLFARHFLWWLPLCIENVHLRESACPKFCSCLGFRAVLTGHHSVGCSNNWLLESRRLRQCGLLFQCIVCIDGKFISIFNRSTSQKCFKVTSTHKVRTQRRIENNFSFTLTSSLNFFLQIQWG